MNELRDVFDFSLARLSATEFVVIKYHVGLTGLGEALDPVQEWNFSLKLDSLLLGQSASLMMT